MPRPPAWRALRGRHGNPLSGDPQGPRGPHADLRAKGARLRVTVRGLIKKTFLDTYLLMIPWDGIWGYFINSTPIAF